MTIPPYRQLPADDPATRMLDVGELRLHVVEAGPPDGELVVLLHGFPEFWWSWRHQLPTLAAAGYRVVAPDLRGYNLSDRPTGVEPYRMRHHIADLEGLISALGRTRAHVVGHDWGGQIAWSGAAQRPARIASLAVLNCPHPRVMLRALARPSQLCRSWYILAFQIPMLPEVVLRMRDARVLRRLFRGQPDEAVARYVEAARRGGDLRGPINYYRAAARDALTAAPTAVAARTLVVWGCRDPVFDPDLADPDPRLVPRVTVARFPTAGHAVHRDEPARVNRLLLDHFAATAAS